MYLWRWKYCVAIAGKAFPPINCHAYIAIDKSRCRRLPGSCTRILSNPVRAPPSLPKSVSYLNFHGSTGIDLDTPEGLVSLFSHVAKGHLVQVCQLLTWLDFLINVIHFMPRHLLTWLHWSERVFTQLMPGMDALWNSPKCPYLIWGTLSSASLPLQLRTNPCPRKFARSWRVWWSC